MSRSIRTQAAKVALGVLIILLGPLVLDIISNLAASPAHTPPSKVEMVLDYGSGYFSARAAAGSELKRNLEPLSQNANFVVNYLDTDDCSTTGLPDFMPAGTPTSWSQEARDAFAQAVSIWTLLLNANHTIVINACWLDLDSSEPLAMAQPVSAYAGFLPTVPVTNTLYPVALANELAGNDLNDFDGSDHDGDGKDADVEIIIIFNSDSSIDWYFGSEANPPAGQFDFVTTALHEIGHGLGFVSTMFVDTGDNACETNNTGDGCWGIGTGLNGMPAIYDRFIENGSGDNLIDTFPNQSTQLGNALTSGAVFFNGSLANSANGGGRPRLYAPNPFELSSSILHLDEATYSGPPDQLMTPIIDSPQHHPGPIALAMLEDMGWNVAELPFVTLTQSASASAVTAGQVLTYTLTVTNTGYVIMTDVVITDTVPSNTTLDAGSLNSGDVTTSGTTPGSLITWTTGVSLTTARALSRTFAVTVDAELAGVSTITNTASVTSTAGVGANATLYTSVIHRTYLPLILLE